MRTHTRAHRKWDPDQVEIKDEEQDRDRVGHSVISRYKRPPSVRSVPIPDSAAAFAADIQTVMSVLRVIKSSEIAEFARDIRSSRNNEEKLFVLVKHHHLLVKLESI
ncbi:hypothetical protein EVAR_31413_1 [Eumeta japonica]|uniref:Uncharacterized protein n=1 Tax=Eumeta variegata TaxID=151549 RepID=A0A4C1UXU8_EUMVA|nr:hypothetical protein EVAR_31413_1 [Eumeta japonica]